MDESDELTLTSSPVIYTIQPIFFIASYAILPKKKRNYALCRLRCRMRSQLSAPPLPRVPCKRLFATCCFPRSQRLLFFGFCRSCDSRFYFTHLLSAAQLCSVEIRSSLTRSSAQRLGCSLPSTILAYCRFSSSRWYDSFQVHSFLQPIHCLARKLTVTSKIPRCTATNTLIGKKFTVYQKKSLSAQFLPDLIYTSISFLSGCLQISALFINF